MAGPAPPLKCNYCIAARRRAGCWGPDHPADRRFCGKILRRRISRLYWTITRTSRLRDMQMNIAEAKAKLSELVAAAERGEEVIIARGGSAVVRLVPANSGKGSFRFGIAGAEVASLPDFLEPMTQDELKEWN